MDRTTCAPALVNALALKPGRVLCLFTRTAPPFAQGLLDTYRKIIPEDEKDKVDRFIFEKDRHTCLITRALVRYALNLCTGTPPERFAFELNAYGKPALVRDTLLPDIRFNLSHTTGMTACALSLGTDIGLDVEDTGREVDRSIADRYFAPREVRIIEQRPEAFRQACFFELWTFKESYIKARGMGLSIPLDQFAFDIDAVPVRIQMDQSLEDIPEEWQFYRFYPGPHHTAALSIRKGKNPDYDVRIFECVPFHSIYSKNIF